MDRHPGRFTLQFSRVVILSVARWQSGYAADCNSVYAGSIPTLASIFLLNARVAELVDAADLKSVSRNRVRVQVPPWAP